MLDDGFDDYAVTINEDGKEDDYQNTEIPGAWSLFDPADVHPWAAVGESIANIENQVVKPKSIKIRNRFDALQQNEDEAQDNQDVDNQEIHSMSIAKDGKVEIELTLDSGSADHVLPNNMFPNIKLRKDTESKKFFVDAGGKPIENEGEKLVPFLTPLGREQKIRWRFAKVVRPLVSMGKLEDAGCEIVATKGKGHIYNPHTKERIPLYKTRGTYKFKMWVDIGLTGPVFTRRG